MSTGIVPEICPPQEWNLTAEDIHQMVDALEETYQIYRPAFERGDQAAHGWVYLKGLLSDIPRKVKERIALRFGENVRGLQHFIGQSLSIFARDVPTDFRPRWPTDRDGAWETPSEKRVDDKRNGDQSEGSLCTSCSRLEGR